MNSIEMLSVVARGLGPLKNEVVFVGGATIELYITGEQPGVKFRPTDDVDCVVEVASRVEYHKIEERLRELGFQHPMDERAPICRWKFQGILVDVMPIEGRVLGFSNRWYPEGFATSVMTKLPDGQEIRIFALPYLIASKLEAFKDRGKGDFVGSTDMEDIIAVLDGVPDFQEQIERASEPVKAFLRNGFEELLRDERFLDALEGHLPPLGREKRVQRANAILKKLAE